MVLISAGYTVVWMAVFLWMTDYCTSTITYDNRYPGLQFDSHPSHVLSLPENITQVEHRTTKVSSKIDCVLACVGTTWCRSVNFKIRPESDHQHICEMLATDIHTNSEHLEQNEKFIHLSLKNPCEERPCQNNGSCTIHSNRLDYLCQCEKDFTGERCQNGIQKDCSDIFKTGERRSGIYLIDPDNQGPFQVYCDMTTDGGGWTVFQRRQDGSVDFYLGWQEYKSGLGKLDGEFWLGNDYIHRLTTRTASTLRVDTEDWNGVKFYAKYGSFSIGNEGDKYRLNVGSYLVSNGDALSYHNAMFFSTKDRDNDLYSGSCAVSYTGAWWYKHCHQSNLNGRYLGNTVNAKGVSWHRFKSNYYSFKRSEMKTRPTSF